MNEQETILAGKIGLLISIVLWLLCTWRLWFHSCLDCFVLRWPGRDNEIEGDADGRGGYHSLSQALVPPSGTEDAQQEQSQRCACVAPCLRWVTRRRAFHVLLWISTLFEILSYADLSGILSFSSDRLWAENVGSFLLNVLGRTLELVAFCTVAEIWLRTAIDARPRLLHSEVSNHNIWLHWLIYSFVFVMSLLVLASVSLSVVVALGSPTQEYMSSLPLSKLQTLLEAVCWGVLALMVSVSIGMTSNCVLVLVPPIEWKRRLYLLSKAVGPMLVSCFAYATRCGWLVAAYMDPSRRDSWAWWISFAWIPTATASIMLLYSTRKRDNDDVEDMATIEANADGDNVNDSSDADLQQSLLRPQPPEEAFRAFHIFRRGEEDADDSFSLSSPVPRNPRNVVETVAGQEA